MLYTCAVQVYNSRKYESKTGQDWCTASQRVQSVCSLMCTVRMSLLLYSRFERRSASCNCQVCTDYVNYKSMRFLPVLGSQLSRSVNSQSSAGRLFASCVDVHSQQCEARW